VEAFCLDAADHAVAFDDGAAANLERAKIALLLAMRLVDASALAAVLDLAQKLDDDGHTVDSSSPAEARVAPGEPGLLQVAVQRPICLVRALRHDQREREVDVRRADVGWDVGRQRADQVSRHEPADKDDALAPW